MERWKRILHKILFPGLAIVLLCTAVTIALLVYTFVFNHEDSPIACPAYAFSAYTLTIACIWTAKEAGETKKRLEKAVRSVPLLDRYLTDAAFKVHVSLYLSLGINILYAAIKMASGIYYHSIWFGTLSAYYMLLALMRFLLLRKTEWETFGKDLISEWKKYRLCGYLLLAMNIALSGVVILVIFRQEGFQYAGYLIYVMALYAFYTIIAAAWKVIKYRKFNSPVMSAAKAINLAAALVSMLSLETAMLEQFNDVENPERFRRVMTGATGAGVCLLVLAMAVSMILRSTRKLALISNKKAGI